jgi:hypothetical protein
MVLSTAEIVVLLTRVIILLSSIEIYHMSEAIKSTFVRIFSFNLILIPSWSVRDYDCSPVLNEKTGAKGFTNFPRVTELKIGRTKIIPEPKLTRKISQRR